MKKIVCNMCGKELKIEQDILKEDALFVNKNWGYFSKKDLQIHQFVICEDCYDKMIEQFKKPIEIQNQNEAMN